MKLKSKTIGLIMLSPLLFLLFGMLVMGLGLLPAFLLILATAVVTAWLIIALFFLTVEAE